LENHPVGGLAQHGRVEPQLMGAAARNPGDDDCLLQHVVCRLNAGFETPNPRVTSPTVAGPRGLRGSPADRVRERREWIIEIWSNSSFAI
jgi:hypothetical protein